MRAASTLQVTLREFSAWHGALAALTTSVVIVLTAWALHPGRPQSSSMLLLAGAAIAVALHLAAVLWRVPAVRLGWNGESWQLKLAQAELAEPLAGRLEVRLDLGNWMLLRFVPDPESADQPAIWLPVQRGAPDLNWHELRSVIFSPQITARRRVAKDA